MRLRTLAIVGLSLVTLATTSCKKDRVENDSFEPMDEFYNENKPEEQEFTITSDTGKGPIIGKDSTELYVGRALFEDANGQTPDLPFKVKLIELYTYKDMILYRMPSVSSGTVCETAGDIKVRACKDGADLKVKNGLYYGARLNGPHPYTAEKKVYQGDHPSDKYSNWNLASDGSTLIDSAGKCMMGLGKLGWSMGANPKAANSKTDINFTVKGTGGEYIDLFVIMKGYHGLLKGNNLVVKDVPVGENVTVLAMAKNQDKKFVVHQQDLTVTNGLTIDLKMDEKSKDDLLNILGSL